jgi:hypothetical protein
VVARVTGRGGGDKRAWSVAIFLICILLHRVNFLRQLANLRLRRSSSHRPEKMRLERPPSPLFAAPCAGVVYGVASILGAELGKVVARSDAIFTPVIPSNSRSSKCAERSRLVATSASPSSLPTAASPRTTLAVEEISATTPDPYSPGVYGAGTVRGACPGSRRPPLYLAAALPPTPR